MSDPNNIIEQAMGRAAQLHRSGQWGQAEAIYRQILQVQPENATAMYLLGLIALDVGQPQAAAELLSRAISIRPDMPDFHLTLSRALEALGQKDAANQCFEQAMRMNIVIPETLERIAVMLEERGRLDEAIAALQKFSTLRAPTAPTHMRFVRLLHRTGRLDGTLAQWEAALTANPGSPNIVGVLTAAYDLTAKYDKSVAMYRKYIEVRGPSAPACSNLAAALHQSGQFDEAVRLAEQAIFLDAGFAPAHLHLARTLLLQGKFERGWDEYEWRWRCEGITDPRRAIDRPMWNREDLSGKTLLVYSEPRFDDIVQYARYIPVLAQKGVRVILDCPEPLRSILQRVQGVAEVFGFGQPLPPFDMQAPLCSLPRLLGTTLDTIPATGPYLNAVPENIAHWRSKLTPHHATLTVGLEWDQANLLTTSLQLSTLAPFGGVEGLNFVALMKCADPQRETPGGMNILHPTAMADASDLAALISTMDLVISSGGLAAHLAGAMGKAAWVLAPRVPDFRWLLDRSDSPWYPKTRLIRQPADGQWTTVIDRAVKGLISARDKRRKSTGATAM